MDNTDFEIKPSNDNVAVHYYRNNAHSKVKIRKLRLPLAGS